MPPTPSDTAEEVETAAPEPTEFELFAARVAEAVGGTASVAFDTAKVRVPVGSWTAALTIARDEIGLVFFSWLSAIDWASKVAVGDSLRSEVEDRIELLCGVGDVTKGRIVIFSTDLSADSPAVASLVPIYAGADWHEREAREMFGIVFEGHPNPVNLYLPDGFIGHPLRKSFPLLSREVKPWPGKVDVEGMPGARDDGDADATAGETAGEGGPTTENPEG